MARRRSLTELRDLALEQDVRPQEDQARPRVPPASTRSRGRDRDPAAKRNKWVQLNVFVPERIRQELKIRALREGRDMSDIVVELLGTYLGE